MRAELFGKWHKCKIKKNHFIASVIGDVDQLIFEEARIERVINRADTRNAIPAFKMTIRVPRECADAIAKLDTITRKTLREFQRA